MKKLTSPKFLIFLTVFMSLVGYGILFPVLALYEAKFNVGPFLIAAAMGGYPIAQFFAGPILGMLSDRFGRRPLLLFSLLGTFIAFLLFAYAGNIYIFLLARIIDGVSGGNVSIAQAYMADITTKEKRTEGMGIISGAISLGFVVGPVIGGILGQYGLIYPALAAAFLALVNLVLAFFFLPETEKEEMKEKAAKIFFIREIISHLRTEKIGLAMTLFFLVQMTWSLHLPIFSLFLEQKFAIGTLIGGFLFAYRGLVSTVVQLFLIKKGVALFGETKLLRLGIMVMILGLLITSFSPTVFILILGLTLMELGGDFVGPVTNGLVSEKAKPEEQGEVMGVMSSMGSLGRIFGPYVGGLVFQELGIAMPFLVGVFMMGLGLVMMFVL